MINLCEVRPKRCFPSVRVQQQLVPSHSLTHPLPPSPSLPLPWHVSGLTLAQNFPSSLKSLQVSKVPRSLEVSQIVLKVEWRECHGREKSVVEEDRVLGFLGKETVRVRVGWRADGMG